jgi:hypothetical protein
MGSDPYQAKGWPRVNSETRSPLEHFVVRLRELGATEDEVSAVVETWDQFDPDPHAPEAWTHAQREAVMRLGDNELRQMIVDGRREYAYSTTTQEEADRKAAKAAELRAMNEAQVRIDGSVASVMAWVGDDVVRAMAALAAEREGGAPRKTLVARLEDLLRGS